MGLQNGHNDSKPPPKSTYFQRGRRYAGRNLDQGKRLTELLPESKMGQTLLTAGMAKNPVKTKETGAHWVDCWLVRPP